MASIQMHTHAMWTGIRHQAPQNIVRMQDNLFMSDASAVHIVFIFRLVFFLLPPISDYVYTLKTNRVADAVTFISYNRMHHRYPLRCGELWITFFFLFWFMHARWYGRWIENNYKMKWINIYILSSSPFLCGTHHRREIVVAHTNW